MAHMLPLSATAGVDGQLLVWDTASLSVRATCQHPEVCSAALPFPACWPGMQVCTVSHQGHILHLRACIAVTVLLLCALAPA